MLLSALLLAAAVQAAPIAPEPPGMLKPPGVVHGRIMRPARQTCRPMQVVPVDQPGEDGAPALNGMRSGGLQYAVMRSIDGCSIPTPIRQVRPAR